MMISPAMYDRYRDERAREWRKARPSVESHYRSRGITDERKLEFLCDRWLRTKGPRAPANTQTAHE